MSKYITISLLLYTFLVGCTERMDIKLDSSYKRLVVDGQVTTDTTNHWVQLTKSADYFANKSPEGISGAIVTINDGIQTISLTESANKKGLYQTPATYYGVLGRLYTLNIANVDVDSDGKTETYSAQSLMKSAIGAIDSVKAVYIKQWKGYGVNLWAQDPITPDYYLFKASKNGVLLTDTITEVELTDDLFFNGNYTNGITCVVLSESKQDNILKVGDTITFEIDGVNKEYFDFVTDVKTESFGQNPLFSGPPANIKTNIKGGNNPVGFFAAYTKQTMNTIYKGEEFNP